MNDEEGRRKEIRRENDREWVRNVDHQIVTLLTGHQVLDRRLSQIEEAIKDLDLILRGDPSDERDGMTAQIHQIQTALARINAVVFVDSTGKHGLVKDVEELKTGEHLIENHWKFFTSVAVALLSLVGLMLTNWDRITSYLRRPSEDRVSQMIEDAKRPKVIHRHYTIVEPTE